MGSLRDYDILNLVGEGAFATVFRVRRKCDHKDYALKRIKLPQMSQKELSNSLNEVRLLASIKSPYIISYKEAFIDEATKSLCIITEYASGGDLANKVKSLKKTGKSMEEEELWRVAIRLISGLKHLHGMKIFHRDLKAANVLVGNEGVKLGDLNVSIVSKNGMAYTQAGTPYYASPEVWNNKPYDSKCDVWSLGCVLYELATHKPPFNGNGMEDLWKKINKGVYDRIPQCYSEDLGALISMCLKTKASDRPSCDQLLKCPLIRKRIHLFPKEEFSKESELKEEEKENQRLLETIRVAKNINYRQLKDKLPKSNFDSKENRSLVLEKSLESHNNRPPLMRIDNLPSLRRAESAKRCMKPSRSREAIRLPDDKNIPPLLRKRDSSVF